MPNDSHELGDPASSRQARKGRASTRRPLRHGRAARPLDLGNAHFFDRRDAQNRLKTDIVASFFKAYAAIILHKAPTVRYVDLFAGRGYYDGCNVTNSDTPVDATPLAILRAIIADAKFAPRVQTWFNEADPSFLAQLRAATAALPGYAGLTHAPEFTDYDMKLDVVAELFRSGEDVPTFAFIDPWGYAGLTRELFAALLHDWGCDVAFFFNYRRVNMGLGHTLFDEHFEGIFGEQRLADLRARVEDLEIEDREGAVIEALRAALREIGAKHALVFRFRVADGRTSHHLVFASKHERGFSAMREKMAQHSARDDEDIPYFEFVADNPQRPSLFDTAVIMPPRRWPFGIRALAAELAAIKPGTRISIEDLLHDWLLREDLPYMEKHYRRALWQLHDSKRVSFIPAAGKEQPRRGTVPEGTLVRF